MSISEIFKKYQYSVIKKDQSEIRLYRGPIYMEWRNGNFFGFLNITQDDVLFDQNVKNVKMNECDDKNVPFCLMYTTTKSEFQNLAGGDSGSVLIADPNGNRINCYVDRYNGQRLALCDKDNKIILDDIEMDHGNYYKGRNLKEATEKIFRYSTDHPTDGHLIHVQQGQNTEEITYIKNPNSAKQIDDIWYEQEEDYLKTKQLHHDIVYKYLSDQLTNIQFMLDEGLSDTKKLNTLKDDVKRYMSKIRQPEEVKKSSVLNFFGLASNCDIHALLDSLHHLGLSYTDTLTTTPWATYFHINLQIEWDVVTTEMSNHHDFDHTDVELSHKDPRSRKTSVYWRQGGSLYTELSKV